MSPRSEFQAALSAWYDAERRDLPWRQTRDPYSVWVSEAMAQQTTVGVVVPYWRRWLERFPDIQSLAEADEDDVLALWQGLGYYRRARSLLAGARKMVADGVPTDASGWRQVPGVGGYTAAAVASIAFGEPVPVVDGNVERVYARLNNDSASGPKLKQAAMTWAGDQLLAERPGDWNQAVMELGALVCTPRNPDCGRCPVRRWCGAANAGDPSRLPTKPPKAPVVQLAWTCRMTTHDGHWAVERVAPGGWWEGMWRFPTDESPPSPDDQVLGTVRHTVTRHRLTMAVTLTKVSGRTAGYRWCDTAEVRSLALPALYAKAWELAQNAPALPGLREA